MATGQLFRSLLRVSTTRLAAGLALPCQMRSLAAIAPCSSVLSTRWSHKPASTSLATVITRRMAALPIADMTRGEAYKFAMDLVKSFDKVDEAKLDLDTHFINDLGLDSLDCVEIIMMFEDNFYIQIPDHIGDEVFTVRQLVEYFLKFYKYDEVDNPYNDLT